MSIEHWNALRYSCCGHVRRLGFNIVWVVWRSRLNIRIVSPIHLTRCYCSYTNTSPLTHIARQITNYHVRRTSYQTITITIIAKRRTYGNYHACLGLASAVTHSAREYRRKYRIWWWFFFWPIQRHRAPLLSMKIWVEILHQNNK